jgi:hypothetical protein
MSRDREDGASDSIAAASMAVIWNSALTIAEKILNAEFHSARNASRLSVA